MKLILDRYYGNKKVTKSRFLVVRDTGEIAFEGEARESAYRDYGEKFAGCMQFCVARGEGMRVDIRGSIHSPMTFKLVKIPGRLSANIICDPLSEQVYRDINIGYADRRVPPHLRKLHDVQKAKEQLTRLAYEAYALGEQVTCDVSNQNLIISEAEQQ